MSLNRLTYIYCMLHTLHLHKLSYPRIEICTIYRYTNIYSVLPTHCFTLLTLRSNHHIPIFLAYGNVNSLNFALKSPTLQTCLNTGLRFQVWHWCANGKQYSFLCPNGTVFNQYARVCDWFFNVDCPSVRNYYNVNEDLYIIPSRS